MAVLVVLRMDVVFFSRGIAFSSYHYVYIDAWWNLTRPGRGALSTEGGVWG